MDVTAWWRTRGQAARLDLYLRGSFYLSAVLLPLLVAVGVLPELGGPVAAGAVLGLLAVHTAACLALTHAGTNHYLGEGPRPVRLTAATGVLTVAGGVAVLLAYPEPTPGHPDGPANALLLVLSVAFVAALSTTVAPRVALAAGAVVCAGGFAVSWAQGAAQPWATALAMGALIVFVVPAYRVSIWMLRTVRELERSHQVRASLAVAEERLRFSRDLHDVLGRTLSVLALKAELAAQLSRRGQAQAVDEMLEVRRIAQESLTELRAVAGGYRAADLDVELAGARSLLGSAGIACRVSGDGAGLSPLVQGMLGWAVREGTTNVLRHSEAGDCTITLHTDDGGTVTLMMENDGVAGPPQPGTDRVRYGGGLTGLTERIAGQGGVVVAERPGPDRFRLTARLPASTPPAHP
ncbi:sensor histidine kinase [Actinoplanes sp. NPDC049599]|uniref:sensor histidine kinase n=1 Tax=Actinoplanes sp. NPDC049599 TaxID=3363903 RepID=UPI0037B0A61B